MNTGNDASKVLVVDDDHDTADLAAMILDDLGYLAVPAYDAKTALQIAAMSAPSAVLLDLDMPGGDGFQLAQELRQLPDMSNVLLICITGLIDEKYQMQALEAGCDHFFLKPVNWSELRGLLEQKKAMNTLRSAEVSLPS